VVVLAVVHVGFVTLTPPDGIPAEPIETAAVAFRYNEMMLERFATVPSRWQTVIVGTSAATNIPPAGTAEPDTYTIALQAGSIHTGLKAILLSGARPRRVFVEVDFLLREPDEKILADTFAPLTQLLRRTFPMLRQENNAFVIFRKRWARDFYTRDPWAFQASAYPSWEEAEPEIAKRVRAGLDEKLLGPVDAELAQQIALRVDDLAELVRLLEERGAEVIFYRLPRHPILAGVPYHRAQIEAAEARFPYHRWLRFSYEDYIAGDGTHPTQLAGHRMYRAMLELPLSPAGDNGD
jgi:hypothetical protein